MLPDLNHSIFEANGKAHLLVDKEVHADDGCDFSALRLLPQTLTGIVDTIGTVFESVPERVLLDLCQIEEFRFFIDIKEKLSSLEHTDREIIATNKKLVLRIDVLPRQKHHRTGIISSHSPKLLFSFEVKPCE